MSDLCLTPTRLALLAAVDAGHVVRVAGTDWMLAHGGFSQRRVDARCEEAERAGWIYLSPGVEQWRGRNRQQWKLTTRGRVQLPKAEVPR